VSNTKKLILQVYVHAVFIIGIFLLSFVIIKYGNVSLVGVVLFGFLVFASDNLSSPLPKTGSVSVNFGITMASLIIANMALLKGYLPLLLLLSVPTGIFTGLAAYYLNGITIRMIKQVGSGDVR